MLKVDIFGYVGDEMLAKFLLRERFFRSMINRGVTILSKDGRNITGIVKQIKFQRKLERNLLRCWLI